MLGGEPAAGHRQRQLDGVRRIRGHEVDACPGQVRQQPQRVAHAHLASRRVERADAGGIRRPKVGKERPESSARRQLLRHDVHVDRGPAGVDLEPERPARSASDRGPEQRAPHPGERVQDQLAGTREELDQSRHQPGRLVRSMCAPEGVPELGWVGCREDRLREVEPFLPGQRVERVGRMGLLVHAMESTLGRGAGP